MGRERVIYVRSTAPAEQFELVGRSVRRSDQDSFDYGSSSYSNSSEKTSEEDPEVRGMSRIQAIVLVLTVLLMGALTGGANAVDFDRVCGSVGLQLNLTKTMFMKNGWMWERWTAAESYEDDVHEERTSI
ncbi:unnamed protein product [Heligmosomoides polygyrus]|uniref:Uncharacterized protein n=1 Tax=Heligmosomoides polygyrus TaxID=6339 RepID=A0A3P8B7C7_HELPZ|nr:unnamed protein product [Heligmosomoides polygyrus]